MKIYFILSVLVALYYLYLKNKKIMHMLQQNYYNDDNRYLKWLENNFKKSFINFDIFFIVFVLLFFINNNILSIILFVLLYVLSYITYKNKIRNEQSKKPLVVTARVKRLYVTELILYSLASEYKLSPLFTVYVLSSG